MKRITLLSAQLVCACGIAFLPACQASKAAFNVLTAPTAVTPGQPPVADNDKIVVNAEKITHLSYLTVVAFQDVEYANQAFVKANVPAAHIYAEFTRKNFKHYLQSARKLIAAYKLNRSPENEFNLNTALSLIQTTAEQAKTYTAQLNGKTP